MWYQQFILEKYWHNLNLQSRIVLMFCFLLVLDIVVQINGAELQGGEIEGNIGVQVKMLNNVGIKTTLQMETSLSRRARAGRNEEFSKRFFSWMPSETFKYPSWGNCFDSAE